MPIAHPASVSVSALSCLEFRVLGLCLQAVSRSKDCKTLSELVATCDRVLARLVREHSAGPTGGASTLLPFSVTAARGLTQALQTAGQLMWLWSVPQDQLMQSVLSNKLSAEFQQVDEALRAAMKVGVCCAGSLALHA